MKNRKTDRTMLFCVLVLLAVGWFWPRNTTPMDPGPASAWAGVGVATENAETLFTASPDGKVIYMWQYFSSKPPKYLGRAEAVESGD